MRIRDFLSGNPLASFALSAAALLLVWFAVTNWLDDLTAWLPWSDESKLERAETRANTAESGLSARALEVEGERDQAERVETFHRQVVEIHTITAEAVSQARSAPDANEPLPADRAARLGASDGQLCALAPRSCATPTAPVAGDAGGS